MSNVHALPGFSVPSSAPVEEVVAILEGYLAEAKSGKLIAVAIAGVERDPLGFTTSYNASQSSRHSLAAGVLSLSYEVAKAISDG